MANNTSLYGSNGNVLPAGDNVIITGTLTVNGCAILTDCSAFNLLPFNANTLNIGLESTTLALGATTGVTTVRNQLATADYSFPTADGTANQVLITNGAGVLSFANVQSLDTNYNIQADTATGGANLTLVGSDATTDSVKFANGAGVSVVRTDANTITITNTDPGSAGVTSITGTANQVIASSPTGAVTLSLPQSIATTSNPSFAGVIAGLVDIGVSPNPNNVIRTTSGSNADLVLFADGTGIVSINDTLSVDSGVLFVDPTNNRVGINNTSPLYELHIDQGLDGLTQFAMTTNERTALFTINDGDDLFSFNYGGANRLQFSPTDQWFNTGKLGVNNATPAYELDVYGTGRFTSDLIATNSIKIDGITSGYTAITQPAIAANIQYILPNAQGAVSTVLTNDGSGNLSWALPGGGGSTFGNITIAVDTDNTISTTTGNLILQTQAGVDSGVITINAGADQDITIQPNGTGLIRLSSNNVMVGDLNVSAAITTNGTGSLYLNTNNYVDSGQMFLEAGVDGDIVLAPYTGGLGQVKTYNDFVVNDTTFYVDTTNGRAGVNTATPGQELTVNAGGDGYCQIGMENTERTWLVTNNDGDDLVSYSVVIPSPFSVTNRFQFDTVGGDQWFNSGRLGVGTTTPAYELDVQGTGRFTSNLIATGGFTLNGTTSGYSDFAQPAVAANISYTLPAAQGAVSTVLTNDGSGNLTWALPGGGGSTFGNITVGVVTDNTISTTTGDLVLASATNLLDAATLGANFNFVSVDNQADLDSSTLTTTATATVALNTTTRNAMTGLINIIQGSNVHCLNYTMVKIDATTAMLTTYAEMYNNISLGSFTADVSAGSLRLLVTPTSATSTVFSAVSTSLT